MIAESFGLLNWSIIIIYVIGTLVLGAVLSTNVKTDHDYYLGGKSSPWWAIGLSVVATYVGAMSFLGGPAWAYETGISVVLIHINYPIAVFIVISVFLPFFYNSGVATIFDYLERRFGVVARTLMSGVFLFGNIAYSGIMLYTTALVLSFMTGMDTAACILIVATIATIYTMMGGISAVIWTDVAQTLILLCGLGYIYFVLFETMPGGMGPALESMKAEGKTNAFNFSMDLSVVSTIWTGIIAMSIYHVTVYGVNQMMVQRTLTAKNIGDAKKSYMLMGYVAAVVFFFFFLLGVLFYNYYGGKEFEDGNLIILGFAAAAEVPGLMGLITAAIVAAAMSSLDSSLNSMATVTTVDFYQKFFKTDASPEHYLKASRWFTLGWAILIIIPALMFIGSSGSVMEILSKIGSFFVGAKLSSYVLGFYSKHTTQKGLLIGIAAGFLCLAGADIFADIAWPWYCLIGGAVSIVVGWGASILLDGRQAEYHPYTIEGQKQVFADENRPVKDRGWYVLPGKVDKVSYGLLVAFAVNLLALYLFNALI